MSLSKTRFFMISETSNVSDKCQRYRFIRSENSTQHKVNWVSVYSKLGLDEAASLSSFLLSGYGKLPLFCYQVKPPEWNWVNLLWNLEHRILLSNRNFSLLCKWKKMTTFTFIYLPRLICSEEECHSLQHSPGQCIRCNSFHTVL